MGSREVSADLIARAAQGDREAQREMLTRCCGALDDPAGVTRYALASAEWWARLVASSGQDQDQAPLINILMFRAGYCAATSEPLDRDLCAGEAIALLDRQADTGSEDAANALASLWGRDSTKVLTPDAFAFAKMFREKDGK
jgi:hypothetical protein